MLTLGRLASFTTSVFICAALGSGQQAVFPVHDQAIPHPAPPPGDLDVTFGWTIAMGDFFERPGFPARDDLLIASINEDHSGLVQVGAVYPFITSQTAPNLLVPHPVPSLQRLTPQAIPGAPVQSGDQYGRLALAIGDVLGNGAPYTFIPAIGRDVNGVPGVGVVDVWDLSFGGAGYVTTIVPPGPAGVHSFGHWVSVGDVDNDGAGDLVVGALDSDTYVQQPSNKLNALGRVYVFFGGAGFPSARWVAIQGPSTSGSFGASVEATDIDLDGHADLVIGASERYVLPAQSGRAFLYRGTTISALAANQMYLYANAPADQVLIDNITPSTTSDWFGWNVYRTGDLGGPGWGDGNPANDWPEIAVHAEVTDAPGVPDAGGLFVFFGNPSATQLVNPTPVRLLTPTVGVNAPQTGARFGRAAAAIDWIDTSGARMRGLLVGEPDASVPGAHGTITSAGRVFLFRAPLDVPANQTNAWGATALLEPDPAVTGGYVAKPTLNARFGGWIVAGATKLTSTADQFVVCAREHMTGNAATGSVYVFR